MKRYVTARPARKYVSPVTRHLTLAKHLAFGLALTLIVSCGFSSRHRTTYQTTNRATPVLLPSELSEESEEREGIKLEEDPDARSDWFIFQRTYPFDTLPADARQRAYEVRPRRAQQRGVVTQATKEWTAIGPSPTTAAFFNNWGFTSGRINTVAVAPNDPRVVLIGSATGGIWHSTNGGLGFVPVADNQVDLAVGSIAFSESNPSTVYAGLGDSKNGYLGSGVLKSTNGGRSWTRVNDASLPSPCTVSKIAVDPTNPNRVYIAQFSRLANAQIFSSGFYFSNDGGESWTRTMAGLARDIAIDPADAGTVYLAISRVDEPGAPAAGLYRSTDRGQNWTRIFTSPYDQGTRDIRVATTAADPRTIYIYTGGFTSNGFDVRVVISKDGGATWTNLGSSNIDTAQFGYNTYLFVDPRNASTVYLGSRDVYKSTDAGASWTNLTRNFVRGPDDIIIYEPGGSSSHPDQHGLAFSPESSSEIFIANDGGVSKSTNAGESFVSLNTTLTLTQFTSIATHPTDPFISYGGTQDNGTQRRFNGTQNWREFISGDGGDCVINPLNPSMVFTTFVRGNIFRFNSDGRGFDGQFGWNDTFGEPDSGAAIAFYAPLAGNGVDSTLYFGTWRLFKSTNLAESWFAPAPDVDLTKGATSRGRDVLTSIGVGRSDTNVIYTGSAQGRAMVSTNGGLAWADITAGLPDRSITSVTVHRSDPNIAFITFSGFGTGHVYKTTDRGSSWTNLSGNLPDIPANALMIDPIASNTIYVGTDIGVFRSSSGNNQWESLDEGMPPVVITGFSSQESGLIQIATYGRGAFEIMSEAVRASITNVTFNGRKKMTISGSGFSGSVQVFINDIDRSSKVKSVSGGSIKLKGKADQLGLVPGENSVRVTTAGGSETNRFTLRL
ncbi:MAG TPA: hypothetical protein VJQ56_02425 [Blastocatellia bacterium]|nr:hypothetical protein [Blastocatellia bacterium]